MGWNLVLRELRKRFSASCDVRRDGGAGDLANLPRAAEMYGRTEGARRAETLEITANLTPAERLAQRLKDEVNEVLADRHYFAREVLRAPDMS